ncbi:hypothetical protein FQN54_006873 [Arachnomyces sp. PD_36]|nr:hypothetical protein FQN54_006873 [Arachnomyces sp. PD_36]
MSTEQPGRSRRSSLSFKSITRMLSRDGRGPKKRTDSPELRRTALASAASLTLPDSGVPADTTPRDGASSPRRAVQENGASSTSVRDVSTRQEDMPGKSTLTNPGSTSLIANGENGIPTPEAGNPQTGNDEGYEAKTARKETKRLQKEKKEMEKQLKKLEDSEENRESRPVKRESRRLSKKQPLRSSSRSSSVKSAMRSSTTPVFSSFRRSISGSRASSSHDNQPTGSGEPGNQATDTGSTIPVLSGAWPERFGAAVSRELASGGQTPYSPYSPPNPTERSLHSTGKFSDLRASARVSQVAGSEKPRVQSMDVSFYQRHMSGDGAKENKPNEGHRKSLIDPYTLIAYDTMDAEPEQRSEQRSSTTPRFYANLHNIQGLAGSESTLKGVARRCPPAYVAPGGLNRTGQPEASFNSASKTTEKSPKYPSSKPNGIWAPSGGTSRGENNRYTAVFKSSSTPVPTYTRENAQRNSMLPSRLRSKHTRFTSSPLAVSSTGSQELETSLGDANKSAPVLLPAQSQSVKPQLPELKYGESELFPSNRENAVGPSDTENNLDTGRSSHNPSRLGLESSVTLADPTLPESKPQTSENKVGTPARTYSSSPVPRKPLPQQSPDRPGPTRSQTLPTNSLLSSRKPAAAPTANSVEPPPSSALKPPPHLRINLDTVTSSVNSEETTSEKYSTASENASDESAQLQAAVSPRSPSPTFNLFGNGPPLANTVPQAHKSRTSSQADKRHAVSLYSGPGSHANSSATLRHGSRPNSVPKMFVICCQCNFWHDVPSDAYAKSSSPDNGRSGAGSSFKQKLPDKSSGTASRTKFSEIKDSLDSNGNSILRAPVEANTAMKVTSNTFREEKSNAGRGVDGKSTTPLSPSSSSIFATTCYRCGHGMRKSTQSHKENCCALWSTTVYMHERHH